MRKCKYNSLDEVRKDFHDSLHNRLIVEYENGTLGRTEVLDYKKPSDDSVACPVKFREEYDDDRIPRRMYHLDLLNPTENACHCRAVYREIIYIKLKKLCDEKLKQTIFEIRTVKMIVGYDAISTEKCRNATIKRLKKE